MLGFKLGGNHIAFDDSLNLVTVVGVRAYGAQLLLSDAGRVLMLGDALHIFLLKREDLEQRNALFVELVFHLLASVGEHPLDRLQLQDGFDCGDVDGEQAALKRVASHLVLTFLTEKE